MDAKISFIKMVAYTTISCYILYMFERCLYFNINALARRINRIWNQAFQEIGLSPPHAYLLRLVLAKPGISQKEIAQDLKLEKSTITRFVNVLEGQGLIARKKIAMNDGRESNVFPTQKAEKIMDALNEKGRYLHHEIEKSLGEEKLTMLVDQLKTVICHIE